MIRILLVEDEPTKSARIRSVIDAALGDEVAVVDGATTAADATACLVAHSYDLLILDLVLPMRQGEPPRDGAGLLLLQQLKLRSMRLPSQIVALTAFAELGAAQAAEFHKELWHVLHFDASSSEWSDRLVAKLLQLVALREQERKKGAEYGVDLAIVTAVQEIELAAVLELPATWRQRIVEADESLYWLGEFTRAERTVNVVAASADEMGMPASAALAMKMIAEFRPRYLAMVGIAAGVKGNFGDVLIAERAWDYGSGKRKRDNADQSIFLPAPSQIPVDPLVKALLRHFRGDEVLLEKIRNSWKEPAPHLLATHMGAFASGASVLEDRAVIEQISTELQRKLVGVEMEAYGIFCAARIARAPRPTAIVIKSICDFGDKDKKDEHQAYAAYTSATFLYEFALKYVARAVGTMTPS